MTKIDLIFETLQNSSKPMSAADVEQITGIEAKRVPNFISRARRQTERGLILDSKATNGTVMYLWQARKANKIPGFVSDLFRGWGNAPALGLQASGMI